MKIKSHLLTGDTVNKMKESPNQSGEFAKGNLDTIVLHYTAGQATASINTLLNPKSNASAHLVVDRDGTITQIVPFNKIAWHAGKSSYNGRTGYNNYSIGIEIVNAGPLTKSGNIYRSWYGEAFNPSDVIEAIHRNQTTAKFWHIYTPEQITAVTELCSLLIEEYSIKYILGHEEVAPTRKTDPGPAFPLDKIRTQLLGGTSRVDDTEEDLPDSGRVSVASLNIRTLPNSNAEVVAKPLTKGKKVTILSESNGWYNVKVEIEGWVSSKFIEYE